MRASIVRLNIFRGICFVVFVDRRLRNRLLFWNLFVVKTAIRRAEASAIGWDQGSATGGRGQAYHRLAGMRNSHCSTSRPLTDLRIANSYGTRFSSARSSSEDFKPYLKMSANDVREEAFPAPTRQGKGQVNGVPTEVSCTDFSDKILITISQDGRLAQWVSIRMKVLYDDEQYY